MAEATGIFILPPKFTLSRLREKITRHYEAARPAEPHHWSLTHQLFRTTSTGQQQHVDAASGPQRTLQIVTLSAYSGHGFVHTSSSSSSPSTTTSTTNNDTATQQQSHHANTIAIPSSSSTSSTTGTPSLTSLLTQKLNALWTPAKAQTLEIPEGRSWRVGMFDIFAGEVLAVGQGGVRQSRGMVVGVRMSEDVSNAGVQGGIKERGGDADGTGSGDVNGGADEAMRVDGDGNGEVNNGEDDTSERDRQTRFLLFEFIDILGIEDPTSGINSRVVREDRDRTVDRFLRIGKAAGDTDSGKSSLECVPDGSSCWGDVDGWKEHVSLWADVLRSKSLSGSIIRRV